MLRNYLLVLVLYESTPFLSIPGHLYSFFPSFIFSLYNFRHLCNFVIPCLSLPSPFVLFYSVSFPYRLKLPFIVHSNVSCSFEFLLLYLFFQRFYFKYNPDILISYFQTFNYFDHIRIHPFCF